MNAACLQRFCTVVVDESQAIRRLGEVGGAAPVGIEIPVRMRSFSDFEQESSETLKGVSLSRGKSRGLLP
ncbi:MAG: hypothetical protein K2Y27_19400 [Xanthobacteraceae bacterium]|nr:hypothetical protein [Xanthobacteraceae bacterium]